ncbi:MAG: hypothetical protein V4636_15895 [Pseudomonadota bacterium]
MSVPNTTAHATPKPVGYAALQSNTTANDEGTKDTQRTTSIDTLNQYGPVQGATSSARGNPLEIYASPQLHPSANELGNLTGTAQPTAPLPFHLPNNGSSLHAWIQTMGRANGAAEAAHIASALRAQAHGKTVDGDQTSILAACDAYLQQRTGIAELLTSLCDALPAGPLKALSRHLYDAISQTTASDHAAVRLKVLLDLPDAQVALLRTLDSNVLNLDDFLQIAIEIQACKQKLDGKSLDMPLNSTLLANWTPHLAKARTPAEQRTLVLSLLANAHRFTDQTLLLRTACDFLDGKVDYSDLKNAIVLATDLEAFRRSANYAQAFPAPASSPATWAQHLSQSNSREQASTRILALLTHLQVCRTPQKDVERACMDYLKGQAPGNAVAAALNSVTRFS